MASPTFLGDGHTPRRTDALWAIEQKILGALVDGAGGGIGGGASQIVAYTTTDPNTDGVVPPDPTKAAIAVKPFGTTFVWITPAGPWDV